MTTVQRMAGKDSRVQHLCVRVMHFSHLAERFLSCEMKEFKYFSNYLSPLPSKCTEFRCCHSIYFLKLIH